METNIATEEARDDDGSTCAPVEERPSAAVVDNCNNPSSLQGAQAQAQEGEFNELLDEPRDDDENPDVKYLSDSGTPSYEQTGQLATEPSRKMNEDDGVYASRGLNFFGPVVCVIVAVAVVWVMRLFLPLIQAFAGSTGGQKALYGVMLALPVFLIVAAIVWAIRVFGSLPAGVDCQYSPDYGKKRALREKLIRKYLKGFKMDESLCRLIGEDAKMKLEVLYQGMNEDIDVWFKNYKEFQEALKCRAESERDKYANAIALVTMASPKLQLDALTTMFFSTRMLLSIARIFNKRTTPFGAFRLVASWGVSLFLSSELQGLGARIGGVLGSCVDSMLSFFGRETAGEVAGKLVRVTVGLGVEGGVNRKMAMLLGDKAIKAFMAVKGLENA